MNVLCGCECDSAVSVQSIIFYLKLKVKHETAVIFYREFNEDSDFIGFYEIKVHYLIKIDILKKSTFHVPCTLYCGSRAKVLSY